MNHARIIGDRMLEAELRRKKRNGANLEDMEQLDDTLFKLWRQGAQDLKVREQGQGDVQTVETGSPGS